MSDHEHASEAESGFARLHQFESRLRQLKPAQPGQLDTEETFYRAGWNAAINRQQSESTTLAESAGARRRIWFVHGAVAGLLISAAVTASWPHKTAESDAVVAKHAPQMDSSGPTKSIPELPTVPSGEERTARSPHLPTSLTVADSRRWEDVLANEISVRRGQHRIRRRDSKTRRGRPVMRPSSLTDWPELELL